MGSSTFMLPILLMLQLLAMTSNAETDARRSYIVHMEDSVTRRLEGRNIRWYKSVLRSIHNPQSNQPKGQSNQLPPEILYTYETTMTAFAAKLTPRHVEALERLEGVLLVVPDELFSLHTTYSPHFLGLEPGRGLWSPASLATDVVIGVLDTGIWPEHVSFADKGLPPVPATWKGVCEAGTNFSRSDCNRKLVGARAFLKGYEAINGRVNETEDFRSPRDSNGHGTHTASTAAGNVVPGASIFGLANGIASGVRYTSRVAAYKVCWASGCASSDILAAIDQAVSDGVDLISLSLGGLPRPYYRDSMAISTLGAIKKGVFVSCSAGNSGPMASTVGNMAPWMATVAASYMDRAFMAKIKLGNGRHFKGSSLYQGKPTLQVPLAYNETAGRSRSAVFCVPGSLSSSLVKGRIVLCERGINSRVEKGQVVKAAGGVGMILLNSANQGEELFADAHVLPAAIVGAKAAKLIKAYLQLSNNSLKAKASLAFKGTVFGERAPVMAAFSSRGPSFVDPNVIKPDITAPGVNILAAWPPITSPTELKTDNRRVLYNVVSGTSMSCPHLTGVASLVRSVHKAWSPAAVKSALMTTAYTRDNRGSRITDSFIPVNGSSHASPFAFGSGHVDPERASDPGLVYDITWEDYMSYLCSLNYTNAQVSLLARGNYTCSNAARLQPPGDLNYPSFSVLFDSTVDSQRSLVSYTRTVTNVGGSEISYKAVVTAPKGVKVRVTPQVLKFKSVGEKLSYKVRFRGLRKGKVDAGSSYFGSLVWVGGKHTVGSPIAVTWQ